jgi:PAS domain S-box-containing protein
MAQREQQLVTDIKPKAVNPIASEEGAALDGKILKRILSLAALCGLVAATFATLAIVSWGTGAVILRKIVSSRSEMKPNTAIGLLAAGVALYFLQKAWIGARARTWIVRVLAAVPVTLSAATIAEYVVGHVLGIDNLFLRMAGSQVNSGRMAPHTALGLFFAGATVFLLTLNGRTPRWIAQCSALATGSASLLALFGYTFDMSPIYKLGEPSFMALPTAISLGCLSIGALLSMAEFGLMAPLANRGGGGMMLRRILPLAIIAPWAISWLASYGTKWGLYGGETDNAVFALVLMVCLPVLLFVNARALNRLDNENERSREVLRQNSEQWQLTFNCMSEGLSYHDPDYNVVGANVAFEKLLSGKCAEGEKCYRLVHGTDAPPEDCPMRKTLRTGQTAITELYEPRLGRHLQVRTDPVRDGSGKIFRVVHVVEDITERKRAEDHMQRLAAIVECSDDAIYSVDMDGHIQTWNRGAELMFGYQEQEILGTTPEALYPPEIRSEWRSNHDRILGGERVEHADMLRLRKNGSSLNVSLSISPLRGQDGRVFGSSSIARDITDRKLAEAEIQRKSAEAQQARSELMKLNTELEERVRVRTAELEVSNKELEAFSYSVSHDLRAPLRSLDGFSHILLEEYRDRLDEEGRDFLNRLRNASQQMGQLIDALLQLSRVSRSEMNKSRVDLSETARQIATELQASKPERQTRFEVANGLMAMGDPRLLHAALQNLIGNAWKFTSKREQAAIEFGVAEQEGERVFFVRDNGAGFEMAYANKLFSAFQRLHSGSEFEGSGIGLATVQRIVRRHGGKIWAEGEPNVGATFFFTLE